MKIDIDYIDALILLSYSKFFSNDKNGKYEFMKSFKYSDIFPLKNSKKKITISLDKEDRKLLRDTRKLMNIQHGGNQDQKEYRKNIKALSGFMKEALRMVIIMAKTVLGVVAMIGTIEVGATGDTIVEVVGVVIDTGIYTSTLVEMIATVATETDYVKELLKIPFIDGPEQVRIDTLKIVQKIIIDGNEDQINAICNGFNLLIRDTATIVGDWISIFRTGDAGTTGTLITTVVTVGTILGSYGATKSFDIMKGLFNVLPNDIQELLKNPKKLTKFLYEIADFLKNTLEQIEKKGIVSIIDKKAKVSKIDTETSISKNTINKKIMETVSDIVYNQFIPNIDKAIKTLGQALPSLFVMLSFNEICGNQSTIDKIRSEIDTTPLPSSISDVSSVEQTPLPYPRSQPIQYPRSQPIQYPRSQPLPYPRSQPIQYPRSQPIQYPRSQPIQYPRSQPIQYPSQPIQYPRSQPLPYPRSQPLPNPRNQPIQYPRSQPIQYPRSQPIQYPRS